MAGGEEPERLAVLVVRAWRRPDEPVVVARITYTVEDRERDRVAVAEAGVEAIVAVVRRWLDDVANGKP